MQRWGRQGDLTSRWFELKEALQQVQLFGFLTVLYNAVLQQPAAKLLCFAPRRSLALLHQPLDEFRRHKGPLILDPFLFSGLQKGVLRTHQPGVVGGGEIGRENGSSEKQISFTSSKHIWSFHWLTKSFLKLSIYLGNELKLLSQEI